MNPDLPPPPPFAYRLVHAVMWPLLKLLGLTCKSAFELCSERMDRELTTGEALKLRVHLMMCGLCRNLPAQFSGMREFVRLSHDKDHDCHSDECLSPEVKARIAADLETDTPS